MKRTIALLLSSALLLMCLGCSVQTEEYPDTGLERVTEEELALLREEYPLSNELSYTASYDFTNYQSWDGFLTLADICAVAVVEISGERFTNTVSVNPFSDNTANNAIGAQELVGQFMPAKVVQVLAGSMDVAEGGEIALAFGANGVAPPAILDAAYSEGQRYVCFLRDANNIGLSYTVDDMYSVGKYCTYYLTDSGVLLSMTDHIACISECSGMYLNAFKAEMEELFEAPDAEIDDPTPPVETE